MEKINVPIDSFREKIIDSDVEKLEDRHERLVREQNIDSHTAAREVVEDLRTGRVESIDSRPKISNEEKNEIVLNLTPETHDDVMSHLLSIMQTRGVKNALKVAEAMNSHHILDDFERFLVQYVKAGYESKGLGTKSAFSRTLRMTLLEISVPEITEDNREASVKELISSVESIFAGMSAGNNDSVDEPEHFTIEIAVANHSDQFVFYAAVPNSKRRLFENHVRAIYKNVEILEHSDDYNIFNESGVSVISTAKLDNNSAYPLKDYTKFDSDPIHALLASFSHIDREGEGAAVQFVIKPHNKKYNESYHKKIDRLKKGEDVKDVLRNGDGVMAGVSEIVGEIFKASKKDDDKKSRNIEKNQAVSELLKEKAESPVCPTNIRIVVSSQDKTHAEEILRDIESSFNQFMLPGSNGLTFTREKGMSLRSVMKDFTFRRFSEKNSLQMSYKELATTVHFPVTQAHATPNLKHSKSGSRSAPIGVPESGILLGLNNSRGRSTKIFMSPDDRLRHFYTIGQTGTGKTSLLKNMIMEDIRNGEGVCMIDPHGSDVLDILGLIPASRYEDVIYFDPASVERPMGLNMLEFDHKYPEQKTFVVNELLGIFNKLFDMKTAGGPMFEQYFRNAVLLSMEDVDSGSTLLDVSRVLTSKPYREQKLSKCTNPIVIQFWHEVADKAGGEASLANIVPYITSKFDNFLSNDIMRPIIAQEKSAFNFREVMDQKKILLVNLSKGRLGDLNSHLIGLILVGKILMAALSRAGTNKDALPPFYLYIDEFQNVTTDSISTILSEARKYKLGLTLAHQFIGQIDEEIRDAVFGNVGSMAVFRIGVDDAEHFEKTFAPHFGKGDLTSLDNYHAYLKLLVNGKTMDPFDIVTIRPEKSDSNMAQSLKELSYLKYGRPATEVNMEILAKYAKLANKQ